jgi:HD-like signal output (HDOD) protein
MDFGKKHASYGKGKHQIDSLTTAALLDPKIIVEKVRTALAAPDYQAPMLPQVALELMQLVRDPSVDFKKVQRLVQSEPLIAAKVLQVAQSAMFARGTPITSLQDAIARLGLRTLMDLFLQVSMGMRVFRAKGFERPMSELRRHSVVVGSAARSVCRAIGFPDEYAFLCGLLHDVGIAAGILIVADDARQKKKELEFDTLQPSLLHVHEEAALTVGRLWRLPDDIQLVLAHHHNFVIDGRVHPLAAAVCLADWMAASVGAGFSDETYQTRALEAVAALGLRQQDVTSLLGPLREAAAAE